METKAIHTVDYMVVLSLAEAEALVVTDSQAMVQAVKDLAWHDHELAKAAMEKDFEQAVRLCFSELQQALGEKLGLLRLCTAVHVAVSTKDWTITIRSDRGECESYITAEDVSERLHGRDSAVSAIDLSPIVEAIILVMAATPWLILDEATLDEADAEPIVVERSGLIREVTTSRTSSTTMFERVGIHEPA